MTTALLVFQYTVCVSVKLDLGLQSDRANWSMRRSTRDCAEQVRQLRSIESRSTTRYAPRWKRSDLRYIDVADAQMELRYLGPTICNDREGY